MNGQKVDVGSVEWLGASLDEIAQPGDGRFGGGRGTAWFGWPTSSPRRSARGKGRKIRTVPLYSDVADALEAWRDQRDQLPELAEDRLLFPRLGARRRDGSFPDAGGQLSTTGEG